MLPPRVLAGVQSKPRTCEALGYADQPGTPVRSRHCLQRLASPVSRADSLQPRRAEPTMLMFPHGPFRSPSRPGPVAAKAHPADTHPRLGWLCRSSESLSLVEGSAGRLRCSGSSDIRIGEAILVGDPLSVPRAVPRVPPGQADSLVFGLSNAVLSFSRTEQGFQPVTRPPGQPRPTTHRRARPLGNAGGLEQDGLYSIHP